MFQPNSIKTLLSMKNYNQLENLNATKDDIQKDQILLSKDTQKFPESIDDIIAKISKDPAQCIMDTKILIKEINNQIISLQKWREEQKLELQKNLEKNRQLSTSASSISDNNIDSNTRSNDLEGYEKYLEKLNGIMNIYSDKIEKDRLNRYSTTSNHENTIKEIDKLLADRKAKLEILSKNSQLKMDEVELMKEKLNDCEYEDFTKIKDNVDLWKEELNSFLKYKSNIVGLSSDSKQDNVVTIKELVKKEKEEQKKSETKKYDFKKDLDDIENELKALEDLMSTK